MKPVDNNGSSTIGYLLNISEAYVDGSLKNVPPERRESTLTILNLIRSHLKPDLKHGEQATPMYLQEKDVTKLKGDLSQERKSNVVASVVKRVGEKLKARKNPGYDEFRLQVNNAMAPLEGFFATETGKQRLQTLLNDCPRLNNIHAASVATRSYALGSINRLAFKPSEHDGQVRPDLVSLGEAKTTLERMQPKEGDKLFVDALTGQLDRLIEGIKANSEEAPSDDKDAQIRQDFENFMGLCQFELRVAQFCEHFNIDEL